MVPCEKLNMTVDIKIQIPYTTRPTMTRRVIPAFNSTPSGDIIYKKKQELELFGDKLYGTTQETVIGQLIEKASRHCGRPLTNSIVDLALTFEEDFAIMHNGKLAAVCFCFPSGWCPADKIGLTLAEIHNPVADGQHLIEMSKRLTLTMADPILGKFQRQVWTVTNNNKLSNFPGSGPQDEPTQFNDLYFRWETQTTEPLGDGTTSLFFVAVNVVPLSQVWLDYGSQILESINTMSDAVLTYKNLHKIKSILNNF